MRGQLALVADRIGGEYVDDSSQDGVEDEAY